jgi:hypothetical protein
MLASMMQSAIFDESTLSGLVLSFFFAIHYHRFLNILAALFILLAIQTKLLAYHSAALLTNI